jgi:hypothetical protein
MRMNRGVKRIISKKITAVLLALIMIIGSFPVFSADPASLLVYQGDGFEVRLSFPTSQWSNEFSCTIRNTGSQPIENWAIGFDFPYDVTSIWSAAVDSQEDGFIIIRNGGWNGNIAPNASVTFGFSARRNGDWVLPDSFELCERQLVEVTDAEVIFNVGNNMDTNFDSVVTVRNNGNRPIDGWLVSFDFTSTVRAVFEATLTEPHDGRQYAVRDANWNNVIPAGGSVNFQMHGVAASVLEMSNVRVYTSRIVRKPVSGFEDVDIIISLRPAAGTPDLLEPGDTFTMELHIDNPENRSIGSISNLGVKFDSDVLEWDLAGDYVQYANMPFMRGPISNQFQLSLAPPSAIFDNAEAHPLGDFNAHFSFDSQLDYSGAEGVLLTLNFNVISKEPIDVPDFTLSLDGF